jgi:hypothetical protein
LATRIRISLVLAVLLLGSGIPAARAMQFELVPVSPTEIIIGGRGEIVEGDSTRLDRALASVSPGQTLLSLAIDSPGGSVLEGELMSRTIRGRGLAVVIPANSKCVSACFLLFAASTHRLASSDALIGVHSANEGGQETGNSLAVTTLMARSAADLGVPPAIIGKMVQTTPGRVEWLTHDDLLSMDVTVFNTDAASASRSAGATTTASIRPVVPEPAPAPPQLAAPPPPSAVMAGSNDRRAWDAWLGSLRGGVRDGALYARAQIQQSRPVSCVQPKGMAQADFQQGCLEYQRRATAVDARKRASADYAAGWDGISQRVTPTQPVEAEFRGAYFCGRRVVKLTLSVYAPTAGGPREALFSFGPQANASDIANGAFIVQGSIDLNGGSLQLSPVKWVSQPPGYQWLGLTGRSDDGGRTFSGQLLQTTDCTAFTLRRSTVAELAPTK